MKLSLIHNNLFSQNCDLLAIPVKEGQLKGELWDIINKESGGIIERSCKDELFNGEKGKTIFININNSKIPRIALIGIGKEKHNDSYLWRSIGAKTIRAAQKKNLQSIIFALNTINEKDLNKITRLISEGILLGSYRYTEFLTGDRIPKVEIKETKILIPIELKFKTNIENLKPELKKAEIIAQGIFLARDLVNKPANELTPITFTDTAQKIAKEKKLEITVFDKNEITKRGMNLLLAVNKGSEIEPRFIHLVYTPEKKDSESIAIIGKGITFDSGGLSLKTPNQQITMKCDMAGAALVLGLMSIAGDLKLPYKIHGIIPITENMPSGAAIKPGDVVRSMNGKTVEIDSTDAEGRLILADAITYTLKLKPKYIIDYATLTGSCIVALGEYTAGLFSNDDDFVNSFFETSKEAGESMWILPLNKELKDQLKSDIADMKNVGPSRYGGAITAALFLAEFVDKTPWIHIDIAGPAFISENKGFYSKGATGFGILSLAKFLSK